MASNGRVLLPMILAASALQLSLRDDDPAALEDYSVAPTGRGCPRR